MADISINNWMYSLSFHKLVLCLAVTGFKPRTTCLTHKRSTTELQQPRIKPPLILLIIIV